MSIYSLFTDNKYTKWYLKLVSSRKQSKKEDNIYYENHHIIPRCVGGKDDHDNMVHLTLREHYVAHLLLTKMFSDTLTISKMYFALSTFRQNHNQDRKKHRFTSHQYKVLRESHYKSISLSHPMKGKTHSKQTKEKISKANSGKKRSDNFKKWRSEYMSIPENNHFFGRDVSGEKNPMFGLRGEDHPAFGRKRTEEEKEKIRNANKGIPKSEAHKKKMSENAKKRRGKKCYNNGVKNKFFLPSDEIPEGYVLGVLNKRKWYNNCTKNILIPLGNPVPNGFVEGMKIK